MSNGYFLCCLGDECLGHPIPNVGVETDREGDERMFKDICGCDTHWTIGHIRVGLDYMLKRWKKDESFINSMGGCKPEVYSSEKIRCVLVWDRIRLAMMGDEDKVGTIVVKELKAYREAFGVEWSFFKKNVPRDIYAIVEDHADRLMMVEDDTETEEEEEKGSYVPPPLRLSSDEEFSPSPTSSSSEDSKCSIVKRLDFKRPMELKLEEIKKIQQENLKNMETMSCPSAIGGTSSPVIPPGYKTPEQKKRKFEMPRLTRVKLIHDDDERGVPDIPEITYIETDPKKKLRVFVDVEEIGEEKTKEKFDTCDDEDVIYIKTVKNEKGKKPMICIDDVDEILSCHEEDEDYVPEDEDEDAEEDEEISYYTKICAGLGDDEWEDGDWTLDLGESYIEYNEMKKALMKDQTMTQKRYLQKSIASLAKHIKTLRREILAKRPPSSLDQ